jgi:hypothetical protein
MADQLKPDEDEGQQPKAVEDEELEGLAGGTYVPGAYGPSQQGAQNLDTC